MWYCIVAVATLYYMIVTLSRVCGKDKADELIDLCNGLIRVEVIIFSRKIKNLFPNTIFIKKSITLLKRSMVTVNII